MAVELEAMQSQMDVFVKEGVLESAELLGTFLVSSANTTLPNLTPTTPVLKKSILFHLESFRLFADTLRLSQQWKRAISYYERVLFFKKRISKSAPTIFPEEHDANLKFQIAKCLLNVQDISQAILQLQSIPCSLRTLPMNLLIGKLCLQQGQRRKATEGYLAALKQNPYALEAAYALTDLVLQDNKQPGVLANDATQDIKSFYLKLSNSGNKRNYSGVGNIATVSSKNLNLFQNFVEAHLARSSSDHEKSIDLFRSLERKYPLNLHCILHQAKLYFEFENYCDSEEKFVMVRRIDQYNLQFMDYYGSILKQKRLLADLNKLSHELFKISENEAETWIVAALYSDLKEEKESALQLCERAIIKNMSNHRAHLFRGDLLLSLNRPELAAVAFMTSSKLKKSLAAYEGLVTSYQELSNRGIDKYSDAFFAARAAVSFSPASPKSFTLLGTVLAVRPENREKARKSFHKALSLDPNYLKASLGLVSLLIDDSDYSGAIKKLSALAEHNADDSIFARLADVYTLDSQYDNALPNYHKALSINPKSAYAISGLDRLEKLMRGEDLDATLDPDTSLDPDATLDVEPEDPDDSMDTMEYAS